MSLSSDISLNHSRFVLASVTEATEKTNATIEAISSKGPRWYEVGAAKYREMQEAGQTTLPAPTRLPGTEDAAVPSRDSGRIIPIRVCRPDNGEPSKGILLHIHGGGFVLGSHQHQDKTLQRYSNSYQLTSVSVGYRLAPEDPWPAGQNDCFDVAEYLVDHGPADFGSKLLFICGESVGSCLGVLTVFHLLRSRPRHRFAGVILPFGQYDLTLNLPKATSFHRRLVLNNEALSRFRDAYVPDTTTEELRNPLVSPLYEDLVALSNVQGSLPPAIFLCGTEDPLLDDTVLMSVKWMMTGSEAVVKIFPGAPHAFTIFPDFKPGQEAVRLILEFINSKL